MSELKAKHGVFCCTGNHDYYAGVDLVSKASEEIGLTMLRNHNVAIEKDGQKLFLIGIDDEDASEVGNFVEGRHAPHVEAAFRGVDKPEASILLCHKPYEFEGFAKTNVGLMLSGHTHGGQIVLGRLGDSVFSLSAIASHFVEGKYTPKQSQSKSQLYVSRGLGVVGLPIRINCPPEITKITLTRQAIA
jgi:predicted MPP superfamily phosphohydrolase